MDASSTTITFLTREPLDNFKLPCPAQDFMFTKEHLDLKAKHHIVMIFEEDVPRHTNTVTLQELDQLWQQQRIDSINEDLSRFTKPSPRRWRLLKLKTFFDSVKEQMPYHLKALERDGVLKINHGKITKRKRQTTRKSRKVVKKNMK